MRRIGIGIAGGGIHAVTLGIDRWRRPDRPARRAEHLHTGFVDGARLGLIDGPGLPQHRAGVGIERRQTAAEAAARIVVAAAAAFFVQALHRHKHATVVHGQCAGDGRRGVFIDFARPDQSAGLCIDRIGIGTPVTEVHGRRAAALSDFVRTHGQRRAHAGGGFVGPIGAAAARVQGVNLAVLAGHKQTAAGIAGLGACRTDAGITERPFELELGQVGSGQFGCCGRLKARAGHAIAKAAPLRALVDVAHRRVDRAAVDHLRAAGGQRRRIDALAGDVFGDQALLRFVERQTLRLHLAVDQGVYHGFSGKTAQYLARGRTFVRRSGCCWRCAMTGGAAALEQGVFFAALCSGRCVGQQRQQQRCSKQ